MHYPRFFDSTLLFVPVAWEFIRLNTKVNGERKFRVLYFFGVRIFLSVV